MTAKSWWDHFKRVLTRQLLAAVAIFAQEDDYVRNGRQHHPARDQQPDPVPPARQARR